MKIFLRFFLRSLPLVVGVIFSLTALVFLVEFAAKKLEVENFWSFVIFAVVGLPLMLFGINRLSSDGTP